MTAQKKIKINSQKVNSFSTRDANSKFANSADLDEVAHNEPLHLNLHCLLSSLWILNKIKLELKIFWKFADESFVVCFLVVNELKKTSIQCCRLDTLRKY